MIYIFLIASIYTEPMGKGKPSQGIEVSEALAQAPSLTSVWQACHSASFFSRLNARYISMDSETRGPDRESFNRNNADMPAKDREDMFLQITTDHSARLYSAALEEMLNVNKNELTHLTNADLAALADLTSLSSGVRSEMDQIKSIHANYQISKDHAFLEWDSRRKFELISALHKDPLVKELLDKDVRLNELSGGKHGLDFHEKLQLAERMTDIQSKVYGYSRPAVTTDDLSQQNEWGEFDSTKGPSGTITFDSNLMQENNLTDFIDTVFHENDHAFQSTLSNRLQKIHLEEWKWEEDNSRKINILDSAGMLSYQNHMSGWMMDNLPGGAGDDINSALVMGGKLRQAAYSMIGNDRQYIQYAVNEEGYRTNPQEKHSVYAGSFAEALTGGPRERFEIMKDLVSHLKTGLAEDKAYKEEIAAVKPSATCPAAPTPALILNI